MNEDQRWEILDELPRNFPIAEADTQTDIGFVVPGTYETWYEGWALLLGHPMSGDRTFCQTCGMGGECSFRAFYDAMIASVVRELDKVGRLSPPGIRVVRKGPESGPVALGNAIAWAQDNRGPVTWCEHADERHGPEAGCVECRCSWPRGHEYSAIGMPLDPETRERLLERLRKEKPE
jgi:hypothetical protein